MGNSLHEQLLKAGLVNKKQLNKAKQEKYAQQKGQRRSKDEVVSDSKQLAEKARAEMAARNRQLNLQQKEQAERNALAAQVSQLISANRLKLDKGTMAYNFVDQGKIKKLLVTKAIRDQLSRGQLAIVAHGGRYEVVPAETAAKIRQRDQAAVLLWNEPQPATGKDDPYAEFPIPDDLEW
ncbi:MAG: DUF2058 domain-containing protein [Desulfobulbaceae bacterium]|nr:DUF2058 domain-containing protein [Desulfobulbaceae bacterium]